MSVDIYGMITGFKNLEQLNDEQEQKLIDVFGFLQDTSDSALKILVPLLIAYVDLDQEYGNPSDKIINMIITDTNRLQIKIDCPIEISNIFVNNTGMFRMN